jgi:hypothetical protein
VVVKAWIPAVVAIAGGVFSAPCTAQTAQPQYYVWDANSSGFCGTEPSGWVHDPRFQLASVIKVGAEQPPTTQCGFFGNPVMAGKATALRLRQRRFPSAGPSTIDDALASVVIMNYAGCRYGFQTCLYRNSDLVPEPSAWATEPDTDVSIEIRRRHPWLNDARVELKAWTQDYVTELLRLRVTPIEPITLTSGSSCAEPCNPEDDGIGAGQIIPFPRYFLVDSEPLDLAANDMNKIAAIASLEEDDRWDDTNYPVPGYGITLEHVWKTTAAQYGMDPNNNLLPSDYIYITQIPYFKYPNRRIFMWHQDLMIRVHAAVLKECFYDVIRNAVTDWNIANTGDQLEMPEFSNYGTTTADGGSDRFGWFLDNDGYDNPYRTTIPPSGSQFKDRIPAMNFWRYYIGGGEQESRYSPVLFQNDVGPYPTGPLLFPDFRWQMQRRLSLADFDAPNIYPVLTLLVTDQQFSHTQRSLYLPNHPVETEWQTALRVRRHNLEAAINSGAGQREHSIKPWIALPGTHFDEPPRLDYTLSEDDVRRALSLIRQLDIRHVPVWNFGGDLLDRFESMNKLHLQVYKPRLTGIYLAYGSSLSGQASDLWTTLRAPGYPDLDQTVDILSDDDSESRATTILHAHFEGLDEAPGCGVRLTIEGWAYSTSLEVCGSIHLWKYHGTGMGDWHEIEVQDDPTGCGDGYRFHVSMEDAEYGYWLYMRRSFDVQNATEFVSNLGQLSVQLTQQSDDTDAYGLVSYYDLVQVVRIGGDELCAYAEGPEQFLAGPGEGDLSMSAERRGPDMNADGLLCIEDFLAFDSCWNSGAFIADYNNDGVVDAVDFELYLLDFASQN